jgi:hypothetical protein
MSNFISILYIKWCDLKWKWFLYINKKTIKNVGNNKDK